MKRYGLAYEDLKPLNEKLIMLSISGFGQQGPESTRAAYAPILHAESGWLQRSADWNQQPVSDLNLSAADTNASLHGTIGLLAALRVAELTGQGQHIDMCMLDAFLATDDASHLGLDDVRFTSAGGLVWEGFGPVLTAGDFRWIWKQLHDIHGIEDGAPEDADIPTKRSYREAAINDFLSSFETREEMYRALDECNLAWGDIKTTSQAFESPTAKHRDTSVAIDARDGATRRVTQTPYRFSESDSGIEPGDKCHIEVNIMEFSKWLGATMVEALSQAGVLLEENALWRSRWASLKERSQSSRAAMEWEQQQLDSCSEGPECWSLTWVSKGQEVAEELRQMASSKVDVSREDMLLPL